MNNPTTSRRNVAKAALWAAPVVTVAAASPATAASCDPTSNVVTRVVNLTWSTSGDIFSTPSTASVTYVNTGPEALVAGAVLTFVVTGTFDRTAASDPSADPTALPSSASVSAVGSVTNDADVYKIVFTTVLGADLNVNQSIGISLNTTGFGSTAPGEGDYTGSSQGQSQNDASASPQSVVLGCETVQTVLTTSQN